MPATMYAGEEVLWHTHPYHSKVPRGTFKPRKPHLLTLAAFHTLKLSYCINLPNPVYYIFLALKDVSLVIVT